MIMISQLMKKFEILYLASLFVFVLIYTIFIETN